MKHLKVLTHKDVVNLLTTALEGGSSYWHFIDNNTVEQIYTATENMKGKTSFADRLLVAVQNGVSVDILDTETDEKLGTLTPESWTNAEKLMIEKHRVHLGHILTGDDDAATADVFFQLAVMGELRFG